MRSRFCPQCSQKGCGQNRYVQLFRFRRDQRQPGFQGVSGKKVSSKKYRLKKNQARNSPPVLHLAVCPWDTHVNAQKSHGGDEFLGIDTTGKSPVEIEREWFEKHYRGDVPQLTVRAVLIGMALGGVMSLSNLYVGLKTGWGLGVAITACILAFSLGSILQKLGLFRSNLSIL